jgi:hypothetical protein
MRVLSTNAAVTELLLLMLKFATSHPLSLCRMLVIIIFSGLFSSATLNFNQILTIAAFDNARHVCSH